MSTIGSEPIGLPEVFQFAKKATMPMLETANSAEDEIHNFSERQLEHEIGTILNRKGFVPCYDFPYPYSKCRADLLTYKKNGTKTDPCVWLEIKFTSYKVEKLQLKYKEDFDKLLIPKYQWGYIHRAYWIWLYLFERNRSSVDLTPITKRTWLRKMTTNQVIQKLKFNESLCKKINEIICVEKIKDENIAFSIMPYLGVKESQDAAALLLVARCR